MTDSPPQELHDRLARHGQEHLFRWWAELNDSRRQALVLQAAALDLPLIEQLIRQAAENADDAPEQTPAARARRAQPPAGIVRLPRSSDERAAWDAAAERGSTALRSGRVGVILVAGGQGTRLDFPKPKGMFPVGPVSQASLYQLLAEQVLARSRQAGVRLPYYIMTSDATHDDTVAFFENHDWFGLDEADVHFFRQGAMPAVDCQTGRILLADRGRIALSPDGHGGIVAALAAAGLFDDMRRRGIDLLFYHQVDNPTVRIAAPEFLGWHLETGSEMSTRVVAKSSAEEKMGVLVDVDGRTQIIEYSDMPADVAAATDDSGGLRLWAGNTAVHIFNRDFLERLAADHVHLPFHIAHKAVPHLDGEGNVVTPDRPNAWKFERFIFDALPHAERTLVLEADRSREFNPVKNRDGADSPDTVRAALSALHADWLRQAGAELADGVTVEISPLFAIDAADLAGRVSAGTRFEHDTYLRPE